MRIATQLRTAALLAALVVFATAPAGAQRPLAELRSALEQRAAQHRGVVGLAVIDLATGDTLSIRGSEPFPTASVVKVPILVELFHQTTHGALRLDDPIEVVEADKVPGSGILRYLSTPHRLSVRDAATLMIVLSDNTATNLVLDKLGIRAVNARMDTLGLPGTRLFAEVFRRSSTTVDPEGSERWGLGVTTPLELARLFEMLYRGTAVSPEASRQMLDILRLQFSGDRIPRYLPGVGVAHKTGEVNAARNDCGVVYGKGRDFVLCILTQENEDTSWRLDNEALLLGADLARLVHDGLVAGEGK